MNSERTEWHFLDPDTISVVNKHRSRFFVFLFSFSFPIANSRVANDKFRSWFGLVLLKHIGETSSSVGSAQGTAGSNPHGKREVRHRRAFVGSLVARGLRAALRAALGRKPPPLLVLSKGAPSEHRRICISVRRIQL